MTRGEMKNPRCEASSPAAAALTVYSSHSPAAPAILISGDSYASPEMLAEMRALAPNARILTQNDLSRQPELMQEVEVVLGYIPPSCFSRPDALRGLKWLHTTWAGAEWLENPEVRALDFVVTSSHIHGEAISEHLFGMLLTLTRRLHDDYRRQLERQWDHSDAKPHELLAGKTLCVAGLGTIGGRCAALGKAFGMRVAGICRHPRPMENVERVFGPDERAAALELSDVVMDVLPLTRETRGFFGAAEFAAMRPRAYFLNAGRGATVDTGALISALRSGRLAGAGIDTVDPEPLPPEHPLWALPNVVITPHIAGAHPQYARNAFAVFLANLRRYLAGEPLQSAVDRERGY